MTGSSSRSPASNGRCPASPGRAAGLAGAARRAPGPTCARRPVSRLLPRSRGQPQVVPVSNGENIFTASANAAQGPRPAISCFPLSTKESTGSRQLSAFQAVIHGFIHSLPKGYRVDAGEHLNRFRAAPGPRSGGAARGPRLRPERRVLRRSRPMRGWPGADGEAAAGQEAEAARDQAGLRAGLGAQIAAAEQALQARAEHAEAELQRARANRDMSRMPSDMPGPALGPAAGALLPRRAHRTRAADPGGEGAPPQPGTRQQRRRRHCPARA